MFIFNNTNDAQCSIYSIKLIPASLIGKRKRNCFRLDFKISQNNNSEFIDTLPSSDIFLYSGSKPNLNKFLNK